MILSTYGAFRAIFAPDITSLDAVGYPRWDASLLRKNNFASLTGVPAPIVSFPILVTCNGGIVDGGSAYDWYLSQRTDDPTRQYFSIGQFSATKSGAVAIDLTPLAVTALGLANVNSPLDEDQLVRLLKYVTLYCQRHSDQSIQLVQLLPTTLGG